MVVRDNGNNFVAELRDTGVPNISCLAHVLQLVVKDGWLAQPVVAELIGKLQTCRALQAFKHCPSVTFEDTRTIRLIAKVANTRQIHKVEYNTTFYMLQRLLELKVAITTVGAEFDIPFEFSSSNWTLTEKMSSIWRSTHEVSSNYATVAIVIPVVNSIMCFLNVSDNDADNNYYENEKEMIRSLKDFYKHTESNEYYAIATLLDPRLKQGIFSSLSSAVLAKQMLIAAHEELEMKETTDVFSKCARLDQETQEETDANVAAKRKSLLWKNCDELSLMVENS